MSAFDRLSMKTKLMAIAIGGVFLCSTSLILIVSRLSETALRKEILDRTNALAVAKADELSDAFLKLKADTKSLSDTKFIQDALVSYENVANGTGLDLETDVAVSDNASFQKIGQKYADTFQDYLGSLPWKSFSVVLTNGFVSTSVGDSELPGQNLLRGRRKESVLQTCVSSALKSEFYFSGLASLDGKQRFYLCQKIVSRYDRDGYKRNEPMGVLLAELKWEFIAGVGKFHDGLGEHGYLIVTDAGRAITPPKSLGSLSLDELYGKDLRNHGVGSDAEDFSGQKVLIGAKKISVPGDHDWSLEAIVVSEEALAHVGELKLWSYSVLGLGLLLISIASWLMISGIVRNITATNDAVVRGTEAVKHAIDTFGGISESISRGTQQQSAAIEQTSASMEEIRSMVQKALAMSKSTSRKSSDCSEKASQGEGKMAQLLESVNLVSETTSTSFQEVEKTSLESLKDVVEAFTNIGAKTKIIKDIAFQTKLLSFNASVEAARAGEHGKGFSVVAAEIGQLAGSVDKSSKEIESFLTETQGRIDEMMAAATQTIARASASSQEIVEQSKHNANEGLSYFRELAEMIQGIRDESIEVSSAAEEQTKGVDEVNKAMIDISHSTSNTVLMVANLETEMASLENTGASLVDGSAALLRVLFGSASPSAGAVDPAGDALASTDGEVEELRRSA